MHSLLPSTFFQQRCLLNIPKLKCWLPKKICKGKKKKQTNKKNRAAKRRIPGVFFSLLFFGSAKIERWWCHWRIALPKRTKDLVPLWRNLTWWCAGCAVGCSITRCRKWWGSLNSGNLHLSLLDNSKGGKINIYFHTNKQKNNEKRLIYIYI